LPPRAALPVCSRGASGPRVVKSLPFAAAAGQVPGDAHVPLLPHRRPDDGRPAAGRHGGVRPRVPPLHPPVPRGTDRALARGIVGEVPPPPNKTLPGFLRGSGGHEDLNKAQTIKLPQLYIWVKFSRTSEGDLYLGGGALQLVTKITKK